MRPIDQDLQNFASNFCRFMAERAPSDLRYKSVWDLLLREGRIYSAEPYTKAEEKVILQSLESAGCPFEQKRCFYNSQTIAMASPLGYAEGYVASAKLPVPIEHGWNTLPSGKPVDLTMREDGERNTTDPKKLLARAKNNRANAYLGISFPADEIRKSWLRNGYSIMLIEDPVVIKKIFDKGYPESWKSPALSGPSPEEEWLDEPEREGLPLGPRRSPEGDVPPWAQRGYASVFPLKGKVVYFTAYIGLGPARAGRPVKVPVLSGAYPLQDVGSMPTGVQFGSEFMFHRFAAVPIRREDLDDAGVLVQYLTDLIQEMGVFGKILLEDGFPSGPTVTLPKGRWFPVDESERVYTGVRFMNGYTVNRIYGGPQEGGWWYDEGYPVASVPFREEDAAAQIEWETYLKEKAGWTSPHEKSSVLGHDVFEVGPEDHFARHYPEIPPQYQ